MTEWIRTPEELKRLADGLRDCDSLAIDSESDSLYHHFEKVCLIQLASDRRGAVLIDPLALRDLRPLAPLMADPGVTKVLHGADYDVTTLKRDFGFSFAGVFDTMIAARFLGLPEIGLQAVARREMGVELSKASQKDDWSRRPLTPTQESYALADVLHLLEIRRRLENQLRAVGRLAWVAEECAAVAAMDPARRRKDKDGYQKVKGARRLSPRALAILRELFAWREARAESWDTPAFKILGNETLLALAEGAPQTRDDLLRFRLPSRLLQHADDLLRAVERGSRVPDADLPRIPREARPVVSDEAKARTARLKAWRAQEAEAQKLDPSVILPQRLIDRLAESSPRLRHAGGHRGPASVAHRGLRARLAARDARPLSKTNLNEVKETRQEKNIASAGRAVRSPPAWRDRAAARHARAPPRARRRDGPGRGRASRPRAPCRHRQADDGIPVASIARALPSRSASSARSGVARRRRPTVSPPERPRRTRRASCRSRGPTPTTIGRGCAATARTTTSSLNAQRSSSEPPPRARMTTSTARPLTGSVQRPIRRSARTIESGAPGPWTRHALTTMRASGQRRAMTSRMSWRTAPESDVQIPIVRGYGGSGRFRLASKSPSAARRALSASSRRASSPMPTGWSESTYSWYVPWGSKTSTRPWATSRMPVRGSSGIASRSSRKIMHRTWARSSFSVK